MAAVIGEIRKKWFSGNTKTFIPTPTYHKLTEAQRQAVFQCCEEWKNQNQNPDAGNKHKIADLAAEVKELKAANACLGSQNDCLQDNANANDDDPPDTKKSNSGNPGLGRQSGNPRDTKNV